MKRKFIYLNIYVIVVAIFAGYNVYLSQANPTISDMALANVEALANEGEFNEGGSGFRWDGADWDTDEHWYNSRFGDWCPVLTDCVITSGIDAGIVITEQVSGKKVVCGDGSGNCVNGSSCTVK